MGNRGDGMSIFFSAGMPRSGSTLLWSLLCQNPLNHLSPKNNGLIEAVVRESNDWTTREGFKAAGIAAMTPRMRGFLRGMFPAFYPELTDGKAVFDDSRGWLAQIPLLEDILERRVQIIVTVRDVKGVCASWENLFRKHQLTRPQRSDEQRVNGATSLQRCQQYMRADATTGMWCNWLKDAFETGLSDRLMIVPNAKLVAEPIGVVALIHQALGLPEFVCDPDNVAGDPEEADIQTYGLPVHSLRQQVDASAMGRGNELPQDAQQWLDENFPSINNLAAGPVIVFGQPFSEPEAE
jgi:sulfotransferase